MRLKTHHDLSIGGKRGKMFAELRAWQGSKWAEDVGIDEARSRGTAHPINVLLSRDSECEQITGKETQLRLKFEHRIASERREGKKKKRRETKSIRRKTGSLLLQDGGTFAVARGENGHAGVSSVRRAPQETENALCMHSERPKLGEDLGLLDDWARKKGYAKGEEGTAAKSRASGKGRQPSSPPARGQGKTGVKREPLSGTQNRRGEGVASSH